MQKAINFLKDYDRPIEDVEHLDDLPNIGESIKDKIKEYMEKGRISDIPSSLIAGNKGVAGGQSTN